MSLPAEATPVDWPPADRPSPQDPIAGERGRARRGGRPAAPDLTSAEREGRGRVLLTSSNFPRWDGDSTTPFILHLAQDLQALGWRIDVLAPHAPGAALREEIGGVSVERFRYCWPDRLQSVCYQGGALINLRKNRVIFAKLPLLVYAEWAAVTRKLATGRYDLLNSHWILPQGFTGVLAAKPFGVPHVITAHGGDVFALRGRALTRAKAFALRHADAVTANSGATARGIAEIAPQAAAPQRIPMGASDRAPDRVHVEEIRRSYRRDGGPLVVFVGRLVEEKGVGDLLRAVSILSVDRPDTTALVVGDGQDRALFEGLGRQLGLEDRVAFTGWVDPRQVGDYLAAADVFVGPSRRSKEGWVEAQGLTLAEAMLAGTPVVATDVGGISDTVRHEETGLLVEEASPRQIATAVARLIEAPEFARRLAEGAHAFARENLTRNGTASRFSELFARLSEERRQAAAEPGRRPAALREPS